MPLVTEVKNAENIANAIINCVKDCDFKDPNNIVNEIIKQMQELHSQYSNFSRLTSIYHSFAGNIKIGDQIKEFIEALQEILIMPVEIKPKFFCLLDRVEKFFKETAWFDQSPNMLIITLCLKKAKVWSNPTVLKQILLEQPKPGLTFIQEFEVAVRTAKKEYSDSISVAQLLKTSASTATGSDLGFTSTYYPKTFLSFAADTVSGVWSEGGEASKVVAEQAQDPLDEVLEQSARQEEDEAAERQKQFDDAMYHYMLTM